VNGRLAPRWDLVDFLAGLPDETPEFVWSGPDGVIAALLTASSTAAAARSWLEWEIEGQEAGVWSEPGRPAPAWPAARLIPGGLTADLDAGHVLTWQPDARSEDFVALTGGIDGLAAAGEILVSWVWDLIGWTGHAIVADLGRADGGRAVVRRPFGLVPDPAAEDPVWSVGGSWVEDRPGLFHGVGVEVAPGVSFATETGPIVLDHGVRVMPHCHLEGPLYVGCGTVIKAGTRIYGESSFGIGNRLSGEIGETTTGDFVNKQHDGFIGHAVLGSWINLGAMTTCSDLKNNYGTIRVDLGEGSIDTGRRFVGLLMGDHGKTAIGTLFNTGTCVGFGANVFGTGMPPKFVPNFSWGADGRTRTELDKALATAEVVLGRRGCRLTDGLRRLFGSLA
jgi:UDP-N-acetylglucosamine diphosphorylase/glucosamine-1-phosphate N-acetyltransferase